MLELNGGLFSRRAPLSFYTYTCVFPLVPRADERVS